MSAVDAPVIISGGGPVGLTLAIELAHRGVASIVLAHRGVASIVREPRAEPARNRPRAKTLNIRTLEHLRRFGLADALRARCPLPVSYSQEISFTTTLLGSEITRMTGVLGLDDHDYSPEQGHLVLGHRIASSPVLPQADASDAEWNTQTTVGRRLPHRWLAPGRSTLDEVGPGFTLLLGDGEVAPAWEQAAARRGIPFRQVAVPESALLGAAGVLVRPDHIVAWVGEPANDDPNEVLGIVSGQG